jgi:hypothetical protein
VAFGVGMLNGKLVATVAANALTIAVKTLAGNDPSSSDPVFLLFRDASAGYAVIEQTTALSITVPSGATLGTVNGQANRIWVGVFNNGGTAVLGVYNSLNSSAPSILPWDETSPVNGTGVTSSSTSAQIWYTAATLASKNFRIFGYVESTQATAGQWATAPSKVQLFGPGVKRPGDEVQKVVFVNTTTTDTATTGSFTAFTNANVSITPVSAANLIRVDSIGNGNHNTVNAQGFAQLSRGTTNNTNMIGSISTAQTGQSGGAALWPITVVAFDLPNTTSSTTYNLQGKTSAATFTNNGQGASVMSAIEFQI